MVVRPPVLQGAAPSAIVAVYERRLTCDVCRRAPAVHIDEGRPAAVCNRCRRKHGTTTRLASFAR